MDKTIKLLDESGEEKQFVFSEEFSDEQIQEALNSEMESGITKTFKNIPGLIGEEVSKAAGGLVAPLAALEPGPGTIREKMQAAAETARGAVETGISMGTGYAGLLGGAIAGIPAAAAAFLDEDTATKPEQAFLDVLSEVEHTFTYLPRSERGQEFGENIGQFLEDFVNHAGLKTEKIDDWVSGTEKALGYSVPEHVREARRNNLRTFGEVYANSLLYVLPAGLMLKNIRKGRMRREALEEAERIIKQMEAEEAARLAKLEQEKLDAKQYELVQHKIENAWDITPRPRFRSPEEPLNFIEFRQELKEIKKEEEAAVKQGLVSKQRSIPEPTIETYMDYVYFYHQARAEAIAKERIDRMIRGEEGARRKQLFDIRGQPAIPETGVREFVERGLLREKKSPKVLEESAQLMFPEVASFEIRRIVGQVFDESSFLRPELSRLGSIREKNRLQRERYEEFHKYVDLFVDSRQQGVVDLSAKTRQELVSSGDVPTVKDVSAEPSQKAVGTTEQAHQVRDMSALPFKGPFTVKDLSGAPKFSPYQRGSIDINSMFPMSTAERLRQLAKSSKSPDEFRKKVEKLLGRDFGPLAPTLYSGYEKQQTGVISTGKQPLTKGQTAVDNAIRTSLHETRTWEEILNSEDLTKDIPDTLLTRLYKDLLSGVQQTQIYKNPIFKKTVDTVRDIRTKYDAIYEQLTRGVEFSESKFGISIRKKLKGHETNRGALTAFESLPFESQNKIRMIEIKFNGSEELKKNGLLRPTDEMLVKEGLTQKEIEAYRTITRNRDEGAFRLLNEERKKHGLPELEPIPGHFPELWLSDFLVFVKDAQTGQPHSVWPAKNNFEASKLAKAINESKTNLTADIVHKFFDQNVDHAMRSAHIIMEMMKIHDKRYPVMKSIYETVVSPQIRGVVSPELQRKVPGLTGFLGTEPDPRIATKNYKRAIEGYFRLVIEHTKNLEIERNVDQVLDRLPDAVKSTQHNAIQFSRMYSTKARGRDISEIFNDIDRLVEKAFIQTGLGRTSPWKVLRGIRAVAYSVFLKNYNLKFLFTQLAQPHQYILPMLTRLQAIGHNASPVKAYSSALLDIYSRTVDVETFKALEWASKNKVFTPKLLEELDFKPVLSPESWKKENRLRFVTGTIAIEATEAHGRMVAFMAALKFFQESNTKTPQIKGTLSGERLYRTAADWTDQIMFDYSKIEKPAIYTRTGELIGSQAGVLATFAHGIVGQALMMISDMKTNPGFWMKAKPLLLFNASILTFAGASGWIMKEVYDALATAFNTAAREVLVPSSDELLLKYKFNNFVRFGVPGALLGVDMSQSLSGPNFPRGQMFPALGLMYDMSVAGRDIIAKTAKGQLTNNDVLKFVLAASPNSWPDAIMETIATRRNLYPDPKIGNVPRDSADQFARFLGTRTIKESDFRTINREERIIQAKERVAASDIYDAAADHVNRGYPIPEYLYEQARELGIRPAELRRQVMEKVKQEQRTAVENLKGKAKTPRGVRRHERIRELEK